MDEKEKLADMAEEKPRKALIYGMGLVIAILASVCTTLFFKLESAKDEKDAAIAEQVAKYEKVIDAKDKVIQDCNGLVISRTDAFADRMTQHYQSLLDKMEQQNSRRNKMSQERNYLRKKDENNIKELKQEPVNNEDNGR